LVDLSQIGPYTAPRSRSVVLPREHQNNLGHFKDAEWNKARFCTHVYVFDLMRIWDDTVRTYLLALLPCYKAHKYIKIQALKSLTNNLINIFIIITQNWYG
jgi:hypothetical protein